MECKDNEVGQSETETDDEVPIIDSFSNTDLNEIELSQFEGRKRRRPGRIKMPPTKVTTRKAGFLGSICLIRLPTHNEWRKHLVECGLTDINKRKVECDQCYQAFSKNLILTRHAKRVHVKDPTEIKKTIVDADEDWQDDPGELICETEDVELGRVYRKKTSPSLPGKKALEPAPVEEKNINETRVSETTETVQITKHCSCCKREVETAGVGIHTNIPGSESTGSRPQSHRKTIRIIRKYQKDGESVEKFEEDVLT